MTCFLHRLSGVRELRERVRPFRAAPFLHRKAGVRELRQRVRPAGAAPFLHRKAGAHELPQACSPFPGREFSAEPQRGIRRLRTAGRCGTRRGGKKEGQPAVFLPLWTPTFPLLNSLAQIRDRRPLRNKGYGRGFFSATDELPSESVLLSNLFAVSDTVLLHMWFHLRRRDIPVSRNSLARCYRQGLRR